MRVPGSWASSRSYWRRSAAASVAPARPPRTGSTGSGSKVEVERLEDLRARLAVGSAGAAQRLLDPAQRLLVPFEQLDLELLEAARDPPLVDDRDLVVDDLGALRADARPLRAQPGEGQERLAAEVRGQEREDLLGRSGRRSARLELEPRLALRQLQLPDAPSGSRSGSAT